MGPGYLICFSYCRTVNIPEMFAVNERALNCVQNPTGPVFSPWV